MVLAVQLVTMEDLVFVRDICSHSNVSEDDTVSTKVQLVEQIKPLPQGVSGALKAALAPRFRSQMAEDPADTASSMSWVWCSRMAGTSSLASIRALSRAPVRPLIDRQRGAGTPAALYCFLSQTAAIGFKMDEGLVAAPICTGGAT